MLGSCVLALCLAAAGPADGGAPDAAADLYAVGAIFHELVANAPFRRGRSVEELCKEITTGEIPELERALPDELEAIRRKFLARVPEDRFASAAEALRAFESWPSFRDRTFSVAEICERHVKPAPADAIDDAESAATQPGPAPARVSTEPARIEPLEREQTRTRWPLVAGGVVLSAVAVLSLWRPWMHDTAVPIDAVSTSASAPIDPEPREPDPAPREPEPAVAAPEPEPAPIDDVAKIAPAEEAPVDEAVMEKPVRSSTRDRKPKPDRDVPDAKVLAALRKAARAACRDRRGVPEIRIDFLIESDGRPALPRSSAPGDARSKCIEQKLRNARFAPGTGRRASVTVTFDP